MALTPLDSIIYGLGNFLRVTGEPYPVVFVALILWICFFIFFAKALKSFSAFSTWVSVLIGLALSFLVVFLGLISTMVKPLVNAIGFLPATLLILAIFIGYFIAQSLIDRKLEKIKELKKKYERKRGEKFLETVGKEIVKKGINKL